MESSHAAGNTTKVKVDGLSFLACEVVLRPVSRHDSRKVLRVIRRRITEQSIAAQDDTGFIQPILQELTYIERQRTAATFLW
jgi:hypothetical protein